MIKKRMEKRMVKRMQPKSGGFFKHGQTKVSQNPNEGLKKLAEDDEKEYGVDDLVNDSMEEEEDGSESSDE